MNTMNVPPVTAPPSAATLIPPILLAKDLPGPMSLHRLHRLGTVHKLDDSAGYWIEHSKTLYGRALIVSHIAPFGTVTCMRTAAWVWLGGSSLTDEVDVLSASQFRAKSAGCTIRVYKRLTLPDQVMRLGELRITSPARTAVDLVMAPEEIIDPSAINALICRLMRKYRFRPNDCLEIVHHHRHHKFAARARSFFEALRQEFSDLSEETEQETAFA